MIEVFFPLEWSVIKATRQENEHGALSVGDGRMCYESRLNLCWESDIIQDMGLVWKIPKLYEETNEHSNSH